MTKILFDIDGVLNPDHLIAGLREGYILVQEGWITWTLDLLHHAAWMRELETKADIVWVSSWEELSNTVCSYFGTKTTFPHITLNRNGGETWKLADVQAYLADTEEPVIWVDDDLNADAYVWAAKRPNTMLVRCEPHIGWTQAEYEQMLNFLASHQI